MRIVDDFKDVAKMTMRMLVPGLDPSIGRADSGTIDLFEINLPAADPKQFQLLDQSPRLKACTNQRAENHVAARAGKTVKVESFHQEIISRKKAQKSQKA